MLDVRQLVALATLATLAALGVAAPRVQAQEGASHPSANTPTGWTWRTDSPARPQAGQVAQSSETFRFESMAPGWHVTMGPGAVLYGDAETASGRFAVEATLILFPDPTDAEYGVFVGGRSLEGPAASWIAFVVRGDGSAAVLRHPAGVTSELMPWTKYAAVVSRGSSGFARNVVGVRAEPDSVRFVVNEIVVRSFPRSALSMDGNFGLRIGRAVNIHVTNLDLTRRFAPFPAQRAP